MNDVAAVNIDSKLVPCAALDIGLESKKCLAGLTLAFDGQTVLVAMIPQTGLPMGFYLRKK